MSNHQHLAIIGSGASGLYLLKHILDSAGEIGRMFTGISIYEKSRITGCGMPYSPRTTDRYNMSNISSEELPELIISFAEWLTGQDAETLEGWGIKVEAISKGAIYPRIALGQYLSSQYHTIVSRLREAGFSVTENAGCEVTDIIPSEDGNGLDLKTSDGLVRGVSRVVIATGHSWPVEDQPHKGYYASPWPISKLLPLHDELYNFEIGTLGASLSAFDVVSSLAHRHGKFVVERGAWSYLPHPGTERFKIIMHAANGLLPHLQFDQVNAFREIYRHGTREQLLALVDETGFLRLEKFYDEVCRPALAEAFGKDNMPEVVAMLGDPDFGLDDFVERMTEEHEYDNAFDGMRKEMVEAERSVLDHHPIHWKEVMDDLMYTLNFHCELMPAEDFLRLKSVVMPFLMNVVAAMPLDSGHMILALYDAGKLDMKPGKVALSGAQEVKDQTTVEVENDGHESRATYRMFIDCSGQKSIEIADYPFVTLVKNGDVRKARLSYADAREAKSLSEEQKAHLFQDDGEMVFHTGGIDIDGAYRVVGLDGKSNQMIHDVAFPHTSGIRPYSYGLQACSDTSQIVVRAWIAEIRDGEPVEDDLEAVTEIYDDLHED